MAMTRIYAERVNKEAAIKVYETIVPPPFYDAISAAARLILPPAELDWVVRDA